MSKYFNPYTDFGFKKLFGTELNKVQWDITNAMEDSGNKGFFKGKEEGEKIGIEKGEKQKAFEMAVKMKRKGYSLEDISEISGHSTEEIESL